MAIKNKKNKHLKIEDISTWNVNRWGSIDFSISKINSRVISNLKVVNLEDFIKDNGFFSDMFNIEYLGYLTGRVKGNMTKEKLITLINKYFEL